MSLGPKGGAEVSLYSSEAEAIIASGGIYATVPQLENQRKRLATQLDNPKCVQAIEVIDTRLAKIRAANDGGGEMFDRVAARAARKGA